MLKIKTGILTTTADSMKTDFENYYKSLPNNTAVFLILAAGSVRLIQGYKTSDIYGAFTYIQYGSTSEPISGNFVNITSSKFYWCV